MFDLDAEAELNRILKVEILRELFQDKSLEFTDEELQTMLDQCDGMIMNAFVVYMIGHDKNVI